MKRYYYNNILAKVLLHFSTCHTIAIAWFVLSKLTEGETSQRSKNHETIHAVQWTELTIASGLLLLVSVLVLGCSPWWLLLSGLTYYLWYVIEWLCKLPKGNAYRSISFEQEAYEQQHNNNYIENRDMFTGWLHRVFKVTKQ